MANTVLVSGGSGFVAGYLIRQLVAEGWMVHTTIRNLSKEAGVRKLLNVDNSRLKFFAADLTSDAGWEEAMTGCSHVAHLASPFPVEAVRDPNDVIVPARDGALRVLSAAKAAGVRRFVMTSSVVAMTFGHAGSGRMFTESDWADVTNPESNPYLASKAIAERTARDWVAAEGGGVEFCTVNPSMMLGPVWSEDFSPSINVVKKLLEGSTPGCPDLGWEIVDVRDVAALQVHMLTAPNMAGERFIASGPFLKMIDVAHILKEQLGPEARKVPTRKLPDFLVKFRALFLPDVRLVASELGKVRKTDASHARAVLGWAPRPVEQTIVDTARSLLALRIVKI